MVQADTQAPADSSDSDEEVVQAETSAGEGDGEINWQERAETAEALVSKASNDYDSLKGQVTRQENIEDLIGGFNDRFDGFEAEVRSRFTSVASGETESMDADADAARAPYASRIQATTAQRLNESGMAAIDAELDDGEGTPLLDKRTAPELEQMRLTYDEGVAHLNAGRVSQFETKSAIAANLASRAARAQERVATKQARADAETASKTAVENALEEAGVDDMSTGSGSAATTSSYEKIRDAYIADPYDAKVQQKYYKARAGQGL